ncbi:MAG: DUF6531 domain-containing protein [Acidobacteriota bacterium]
MRKTTLFFFSALSLALAGQSVFAHRCGPPEITLRVGESLPYVIVHDTGESDVVDAAVTQAPNNAVAAVSPTGVPAQLDAVFNITGVAPGTTFVSFSWVRTAVNPPPRPGGQCVVSVRVLAEDEPGPTSSANTPYSGRCADPVDTASGELFFEEPLDLYLGGPLRLVFQRNYASRLGRDGLVQSVLGNNWVHSFQKTLSVSGGSARVVDSRGRLTRFARSGSIWLLVAIWRRPFNWSKAPVSLFSVTHARSAPTYLTAPAALYPSKTARATRTH